MMNSREIEHILRKHSKVFSGVYAANEVYKIPLHTFGVVNTDELGEVGKHWIVIYRNENACEFFDSLGQSPLNYHNAWHVFLLNQNRYYIHNSEKIQQTGTNTCGEFCIFYTIMRSSGISFRKIVDNLKTLNIKYYISQLILSDE